MISCVSKDAAFYAEAAKYGISGPTFELIVHKYLDVSGDVENFPDTSFVNAQLGIGQSYSEKGENVIKLWKELYSQPRTLRTEEEANAALEQARIYFPEEAVNLYMADTGDWVLRVKEPIPYRLPESIMATVPSEVYSSDEYMAYSDAQSDYHYAMLEADMISWRHKSIFMERVSSIAKDDRHIVDVIDKMWAAKKGDKFSISYININGIETPVSLIKDTENQYSVYYGGTSELSSANTVNEVVETINDMSSKYHLGVYAKEQTNTSNPNTKRIQVFTKELYVYDAFVKAAEEKADAKAEELKQKLQEKYDTLIKKYPELELEGYFSVPTAEAAASERYSSAITKMENSGADTMGKLLEHLKTTEASAHPFIQLLLDKLSSSMLNMQVNYADTIQGVNPKAEAIYNDALKTITFKRTGIGSLYRNALHEIVHAITIYQLGLSPERMLELMAIFTSAKKQLAEKYGNNIPNIYGMTNIKEFLAELLTSAGNDSFIKELATLKPISGKTASKNLLTDAVNFINRCFKDFFGTGENVTLYDNAVGVLEEILEDTIKEVTKSPISNQTLLLNSLSKVVDVTTPHLKGMSFVSGAALGADSMWALAVRTLGGNMIEYKPLDLTDSDIAEATAMVELANKTLNRVFPLRPNSNRTQALADYANKLIMRDWLLIKNSDAIYAIEKLNGNVVDGGTGWAVLMAIDTSKPVYLYDLNSSSWKVNFPGVGWKDIYGAPAISDNSALIGSRILNLAQGWEMKAGQYRLALGYETAAALEGMSAIVDAIRATVNNEQIVSNPNAERFDIMSLSPEVAKLYNKLESRNRQIKNLLEIDPSDKAYMGSTEVREAADSIINLMSDYITSIIEDSNLNNKAQYSTSDEWLNSCNIARVCQYAGIPAFDPTGMSRVLIINKVGIDNLIKFTGNVLFNSNDWKGTQRRKANLLRQNLDGVLHLAANTLAINENIHLTSLIDGGNTVEEGVSFRDPTEDMNDAKDAEEVAEIEGSLLEKWLVDARCEDIFTHMSAVVKNQLSSLYVLDKDGNRMLNQWGTYSRIDQLDAAKQILFWGQGSLTLNDLVSKLNTHVADNPWVKQLIDKLDVDGMKARGENPGKYTDFQNSFFSVFNKHFQLYGATTITTDAKGKTHISSKTLNEKSALKGIIANMKTSADLNAHPLYTKDGGLNKTAAANIVNLVQGILAINERIRKVGVNKLTPAERAALLTDFKELSSNLGYPADLSVLDQLTSQEILGMIKDATYIRDNVVQNLNNKDYNPFSKEGIISNLRSFLTPITKNLEALLTSSIFDSGKMYQSFVIPSYLSKLMLKFQQADLNKFNEFVNSEYGSYEWFRDTNKTTGGWRSPWLAMLAGNPELRKEFKHRVELNTDHKNYMRSMTGNDYIISLLSHFLSEGAGEGKKNSFAWFRVPIMSNKPSSEWIRFSCDVGSDYKDVITQKLSTVFNQELSRIQTVKLRNKSKDDPQHIKNFDTNGGKFCFLDYFNGYIDGKGRTDYIKDTQGNVDVEANKELADILKKAINMQDFSNAKLTEYTRRAIKGFMDEKVATIMKDYESRGIQALAKNIDGINKGKGYEDNVSKFIWNDAFASTLILELTVTDIAYYKDMEDLQKRLAQIHAPGMRGNAEAVDYEGNRVSDGYSRTVYLTDFDKVKSNIISNVRTVFDRKLDELKRNGASALDIAIQENLYNNIVDSFKGINVADAQGYSCPTSYRKKGFEFGSWSREAEDIYQKLKAGTYTYHDLQVAFLPLKPFVYTQIPKPVNIVGMPEGKIPPIKTLKVGVQNKNSEYLLIMADAILQNEDTGQPNMLRAIFEMMEESLAADPTKGIDTVQFESTVKAGLLGRMNINDYMTDPSMKEMVATTVNGRTVRRMKGEVLAKADMQSKLKNPDNTYNSTYVHEIPVEDYCIQQEVPEHFRDHFQQYGSQLRMIIPSDLATTDYIGNAVEYSFTDSDGKTKSLNAETFRREYEETVADNIQESLDVLRKEFHLDSLNPTERKIVISRILQDEILSSPRYGLDMYLACSIDPMTGDFRIPLGDPIQANRVEQMLNSIIKKRVNKLEIAGGPVVQVTNFGASRKLNIRFKSKELDAKGNPKLLDTFEEFTAKFVPKVNATPVEINKLANEIMRKEKLGFKAAQDEAKRRLITGNDVEEAYREYIKDKQAGIDYFEVFAPAVSRDIAEKFMDADGTIDIKTIEKVAPEILLMIGYRIPTEDKYSCAPIRIVGFLPREAGEGIMLPYDITLLTGSDFDIDKEYLMRKVIGLKKRNTKDIIYDMSKSSALSLYKPSKETYEVSKDKKDAIIADEKNKGEYFNKSKEEVNAAIKKRIGELYELKRSLVFEAFDDTLKEFIDNAAYYRDSGMKYLNSIPISTLWNLYKENAYRPVRPKKGKYSRDNKLFDMSWSVLTHETTADKMLNPGGFEGIKQIAYAVEVFKNSNISWEELMNMKSADDIKKQLPKASNLCLIDSLVQFYELNSAASATLGACAVLKIAHATLENNGYLIKISDLVKDVLRFTICGREFTGSMEFDATFDSNGEYIGRVLGSHVAASADAAKEPCMNYLNLTINTLPVYSAMIRLGLPYQKAALFMALPVISNVLMEYQKRNLTDFATIDDIVSEFITKLKKKYGSSKLSTEQISEEELIDNLKNNNEETDFKVLINYLRVSLLAQAIKGPSFITRFNSIINATGPMITDNIVTEHKSEFSSDGLYTRNGVAVNVKQVRTDHPILDSFMKTYDIARDLMSDFPSYSLGFNRLLSSISGTLGERILNNRELLNEIRDFYLSHALIDNKVVPEEKCSYYVEQFPSDFNKRGYKTTYADNEFILSISLRTDPETGEMYLELPTTGMSLSRKDKLSAAWLDLYTKDKALAMDLFNYNFFKGGVGFSPRTFMNLLPISMREKIPGYIETYRNLSNVSDSKIILEQYLEHNTSDSRLFPTKNFESSAKNHVFDAQITTIDTEMGNPVYGMIIPASVLGISRTFAFKFTDSNDNTHYMMLEKVTRDSYVFRELTPRGNNGQFLEMTSERNFAGSIQKSIDARVSSYKAARKALMEAVARETEVADSEPIEQTVTPEEERTWCEIVGRGVAKEMFGNDVDKARSFVHDIKTSAQQTGKLPAERQGIRKMLENALASQGIEFNEKEFMDRLEELC